MVNMVDIGAPERRLRIGIVAPPWVPVPPPSYGGTELVLDVLARGLADRGHEVVLFTTGDSTCTVERAALFDRADPDGIGNSLVELRHAAAAYDALSDCDLVHDHTLAGLFVGQLHAKAPVVTTNHGPFNQELVDVYRRTATEVPIIAISRDQASRAPDEVDVATVIHHGLDLTRYRFQAQPSDSDYLLSLGRFHPDKGIDRAIDVARRAGVGLRIAAKMREPAEKRYFEQVIRPLLGGDIEYVGEVGHADKVELLGGARALLNPIRWPEPFGLVMIEALACGTPVIATPRGAAPEIVTSGTGIIAATPDDLVAAVSRVDQIDRHHCRRHAEAQFSMERMTADHEVFFRSVIQAGRLEDTGAVGAGRDRVRATASEQGAAARLVQARNGRAPTATS